MWHDDEIIDFLTTEGDYIPENFSENGGTMEIPVETLKKLLTYENAEGEKLVKEDYQIEAIKADIAHAKKVGDEYVLYECY